MSSTALVDAVVARFGFVAVAGFGAVGGFGALGALAVCGGGGGACKGGGSTSSSSLGAFLPFAITWVHSFAADLTALVSSRAALSGVLDGWGFEELAGRLFDSPAFEPAFEADLPSSPGRIAVTILPLISSRSMG